MGSIQGTREVPCSLGRGREPLGTVAGGSVPAAARLQAPPGWGVSPGGGREDGEGSVLPPGLGAAWLVATKAAFLPRCG